MGMVVGRRYSWGGDTLRVGDVPHMESEMTSVDEMTSVAVAMGMSARVIACTPSPQKVIWMAMHQDYSEEPVYPHALYGKATEERYGGIVVNRLLKGGKGHYGCLEHPQITFNWVGIPHSVVQQARTHRIGTSFDIQSFRYTSPKWYYDLYGDTEGEHYIGRDAVGEDGKPRWKSAIEKVLYLRPVGFYTDRQGKRYEYTLEMREDDLEFSHLALCRYGTSVTCGMAEEHARGLLPFDYRQHGVVSFNARSLMHFLDLRGKADAQLEIQALAALCLDEFRRWMPEVAVWYEDNRYGRALLAP